jgi:hypothetical protein
MVFGLGRDRLLQFVLHRGTQQPGCVPFIAAASDDASHEPLYGYAVWFARGAVGETMNWRTGITKRSRFHQRW